MNERTTIGGVSYETIGSSTSNLLLKCNGTARIQWGNKLIDLIKNGKLASTSNIKFEVVSDISEIKSDGIYIINTETSLQCWVCIQGKQYNLIGDNLYISANTEQDITVDQQKQGLKNLGIYFSTLADLQASGLQNGCVYVEETKTLYNLNNGIVEKFESIVIANSVDELINNGNTINSSTLTSEFTSGMIMLYPTTKALPEGWAMCNGKSQIWNGETIETPLIESTNDSLIYIIKL